MPSREAFPTAVQELLDSAYWRVVVRPEVYEENRIPFNALEPVIQAAQVRLRGWYFPHLSNRAEEIGRGVNFLSTWSDFCNYEYWRFYQSAQLIHYHGVREAVDPSYKDTMETNSRRNIGWLNPDWSKVNGYIDIINFLYSVTEIFEFAARLARELRLNSNVFVSVALQNIGGYILGVSDFDRAWHSYHMATEPVLENSWTLEATRLIAEADACALEAAVWFFHRFGWMDVDAQALRSAQSAFLRR